MGAPATASLLEEAAAAVDRLLQRPEWLLDPESGDARSAALDARSLVKRFSEGARAEGPEALGPGPLVVEGFDRDQIWEGLELQNVPLRRYLRRLLPRLATARALDVSVAIPAAAAPTGVSSGAEAKEEDLSARRVPTARRRRRRRGGAEDASPSGGASGKQDRAGEEVRADGPEEAVLQPPGDEQGPGDFFDAQEMERFTSLGDQGKLRLDLEAGDSDFDELEADDGEGEDAEAAKNAQYKDFYLPSRSAPSNESGGRQRRNTSTEEYGAETGSKRKSRKADGDDGEEGSDQMCDDADGDDVSDEEAEEEAEEEEEEDEAGLCDCEADNLSEEEKELEAQIQKLQQDPKGVDESDGDSEAGPAAGTEGAESEEVEPEEDTAEIGLGKTKSLYEMDKRLQTLEEEVTKLEEEQLETKPWTLQGEVSAKQRPLNSLLEVHLDQPMTHFAGRRAEDAAVAAGGAPDPGGEAAADEPAGAEGLAKPEGFDIEAIVRQRIWDELFDDVVRKAVLPPSQRAPTASDETVETLNFEKSRVGLGEVYAQQYETEMLGHASEAKVKEDREKSETKALFAKLMHKLDLLTNAHFTPRPPTIGASGEQLEKVGSLKMEETIPLLVSDALLKAPEEVRAPRRHERGREELTHEERVAARRAKKAARKKGLQQRVERGDLTLQGLRERDAKLSTKNREAKDERAKQGEIKELKKRLKASELLEQAAQNAANNASRKDEARHERQKRPAGSHSSKRLKL